MYKVLVVDDDTISLAISKTLLEPNYEVVTAKSSVEAFGCLNRGFSPDIILLDMIMPGTSGMDMLKMLKSDKKWADVPVVFLSSMDDEKFEIEGLKNGASDFLKKPVHIELLEIKLKRHLEIAKSQADYYKLKKKLKSIKDQVKDL